MADSITITLPKITAVALTPNPVNTGATLLVAAGVTETSKTVYPKPAYCGACVAGEN